MVGLLLLHLPPEFGSAEVFRGTMTVHRAAAGGGTSLNAIGPESDSITKQLGPFSGPNRTSQPASQQSTPEEQLETH